jgi:hypothetical protein
LKDGRDLSKVLDFYKKWSIENIELGSSHSYMENVEGLLSQYPDKQFLIQNYFPPAGEPFISLNCEGRSGKIPSFMVGMKAKPFAQIQKTINLVKIV